MLAIKLIAEGLGLGFLLYLICAIGIRNGAVGMVHLYDQKVQERVIQLGLTTAEAIRKRSLRFRSLCLPGYLIYVLICVYVINGARGFFEGFWQGFVILFIMNLIDRFFDRRVLGRTHESLDHPGYRRFKTVYHGERQKEKMDHGDRGDGASCRHSLRDHGTDPEMRKERKEFRRRKAAQGTTALAITGKSSSGGS